jgi:probable O-glycosylation ligase (exosortase A-associated)
MALDAWMERSKILIMLGLIVVVTNTRERLRALLFVTAGSLAFYGIKGGIFALLTGMQHRVFGPPGSFLQDNNSLGLALNMTLPLLFYLRTEVDQRWRWLFHVVFGLSVLAIVSTYSRGGLLGLVMVIALLLFKSKRKVIASVVVTMCVGVALVTIPSRWTDRMGTIQTYDQDNSAVGRLNAWRLAWRLALARPLLGWGPEAMEDKSLYRTYYPDSPSRNDVHSAYFQVLSEGGFPTFGMFVGLLTWCLWRLWLISGRFRRSIDHHWLATYADMLQVSLLAFAVSGTFLELAYFDLVYHIIGSTIILNEMARQAGPIRYPSRAVAPTLSVWGSPATSVRGATTAFRSPNAP